MTHPSSKDLVERARASRWNDPDETRGRALYRARAEAEARRSISMARRVTLKGNGNVE